MKIKTGFICFILSMSLLVSCNTANQVSFAPTTSTIITITPTTDNVVSLITRQEALEQIYGRDITILSSNEASITSADGAKYNIRINVFSCYWDASSEETCLVITDRSQCLGCVNYIDGASFSRNDSGWNLRLLRSDMLTIDSKGRAPKGEIIQIGTERYAIQFRWLYSSTGSSVEHLVIIAENSFDVVLEISSRGEKWISSDKMEYGWKSSLDFQQTHEDDEYYDLIVTYYGSIKGMPY